MIVPGSHGPLSLRSRCLLAAVAGSIGVAVGWMLTRGPTPAANWFLPVATLASALLFVAELVRTRSRQVLWVACLCGLLAGRAVYELVLLVTRR